MIKMNNLELVEKLDLIVSKMEIMQDTIVNQQKQIEDLQATTKLLKNKKPPRKKLRNLILYTKKGDNTPVEISWTGQKYQKSTESYYAKNGYIKTVIGRIYEPTKQ
jgi:hypothetical protein